MIEAELRQLLESIRVENSTAHELTRQQGATASSEMRSHFDAALESTRQENADTSAEMRSHFDVALESTRQESTAASSEMRSHFDAALESTRQESAAASVEMRRHFDVALESTRQDIRLIAESVTTFDEKAQRNSHRLEEIMARGFAETQAMIRFSHAELDRRVHTLEHARTTFEESLAALQGRVQRLEESEH